VCLDVCSKIVCYVCVLECVSVVVCMCVKSECVCVRETVSVVVCMCVSESVCKE